jgi:hypothetical protein
LEVLYKSYSIIIVDYNPMGLWYLTGPAGGNQGAAGLADSSGLIRNETPPVTGALGVIGLAAGPANKEVELNGSKGLCFN